MRGDCARIYYYVLDTSCGFDLADAKWDNIDSDDEADRDRQRERRIAERKAKGVLTETERFEAAARFSQGTQPVDTQKEQMQATIRDFDPAGHQKDRCASLTILLYTHT